MIHAVGKVVSTGSRREKAIEDLYSYFVSALADLVLTGMDEWLKAGAVAREAEKERWKRQDEAAAEEKLKVDLDRKDQKHARWVMIGLTVAIILATIVSAVATAVSAFKPATPIVVPAPVVKPVINVPAVPVELNPVFNPTINVTLPPVRSGKR